MTHSPATPGPVPAKQHYGLIALCCVVFLAHCALVSPFVADDAYIVGRYALNAAEGQGLVYNVGERISALTSPLHALLETLLAACGLDPVASYRVLAPFMVLAAWVAAVRQVGLRGWQLGLFAAFALGSPFLTLWTVGGLETPLLASLAVLFVARLVTMCQEDARRTGDYLWLGLIGGLMFVTRYDSVLMTAPLLTAVLLVDWKRPGLWAGAALCLALVASWLGFARLYYGDIFPSSYYLKLAVGGNARIDSISATLNFLLLCGLVPVLFAVRLPGLAGRPAMMRAVVRGGAVSTVLLLIYGSQAAGQHMMFGYRLFMPYLMAVGLVLALSMPAGRWRVVPVLVVWQVAMAGVVTFLGVNPAPLTRVPGFQAAYAEYEFITPRAYGAFMETLRQDALDMSAHWAGQGGDEVPRVYLRTGGTGYWMREFYVYEALVSYRHGCAATIKELVGASHYMQQLGFSRIGDYIERTGRERADVGAEAPLLFATVLEWMGPVTIGYLYGPEPQPLELSERLSGTCPGDD